MKCIFSLLLLSTVLLSCNNDKNDASEAPLDDRWMSQEIFTHSYIAVYEEGSWVAGRAPEENMCEIFMNLRPGEDVYFSPDLTGKPCPRFTELSERNGDTMYNQMVEIGQADRRRACADNYREIRVVCPNGDWDQAHPAGTLLNDLILIYYTSYVSRIETGDYNLKIYPVLKSLSKLKEDDLRVIGGAMSLIFSNYPQQEGLQLQITLVTSDGVEKIVECSADLQEIV